MSPEIKYLFDNWYFIYFFVTLLLFTFFFSNTKPIFKVKVLDLNFEHLSAILIVSFLWLPILFGINLFNKFTKK